jgi:ATP-binding cassette subfamily F protein 3
MREALAEALQDYDGALIVVAHDRHLLRATTDQLWLVNDGTIAPFDGDLDDYRDWVLGARARASDASTATSESALPPTDRRAQKRAAAETRQKSYAQRKPLVDRLNRVDKTLHDLSTEKTSIEEWLLLPEAYVDDNRELLKEKLARQGDLGWQLARAETEWLELSEALERLDG